MRSEEQALGYPVRPHTNDTYSETADWTFGRPFGERTCFADMGDRGFHRQVRRIIRFHDGEAMAQTGTERAVDSVRTQVQLRFRQPGKARLSADLGWRHLDGLRRGQPVMVDAKPGMGQQPVAAAQIGVGRQRAGLRQRSRSRRRLSAIGSSSGTNPTGLAGAGKVGVP
jgi:hypothetical protein